MVKRGFMASKLHLPFRSREMVLSSLDFIPWFLALRQDNQGICDGASSPCKLTRPDIEGSHRFSSLPNNGFLPSFIKINPTRNPP